MKPEKEMIELLKSIKTFMIAGLQRDKQESLELKKINKKILLEIEKLNRKTEANGSEYRRSTTWRRFFRSKHKVK